MTDKLRIVAEIIAASQAPAEFQLFPFGRVERVGGPPVIVDEEAMQSAADAFRERGLDMVIDYEHQTLGKTEDADFSSPDGKAPAAGWIKSLEPRGKDGLWAKVEWTAKAKEFLANREYRYFSPVFYMAKSSGKLLAIESVALTNSPRLNSIKPIVAKNSNPMEGEEMEFLKIIAKQLGLPETATQDQVLAKLKEIRNAGAEFLKISAKETGLPETSTNDQVIAAIKGLKASSEIVACKDVLDAIGLGLDASKSEIVASIHALKQRPDADLVKEVASLKERLAGREAGELVEGALKAGKITPAQKEWASDYARHDPAGFQIFVAKAPQVVPVGKTDVIPDKKSGVPDDAQIQINKLLGITDEDWAKYGPAEK